MPDSNPPQDRSLARRTEEAQSRKLEAAAKLAEARAESAAHKAREAGYRADAEPERQKMSLRERTARMILGGLVVVVLLVLQVPGLIISPWLFSLNLLVVLLGFLVRQMLGEERRHSQPEERDTDP